MNFVEYIQASLNKGTIGSMISVGVFCLIGAFAVSGLLFGIKRGFSKTIIRLATILLSAFCALFITTGICTIIVNIISNNGATTVDALIDSYFPGTTDSLPEMIKPILAEMGTETATIFVMMIMCMITTPIIFISVFYALKSATFFLYMLLAGLVGAIEYRKGIPSAIFGGLFGMFQGILIASVMLVPVSGLCGVMQTSKEAIIEKRDDPNQMLVQLYDNVLNDLVDNPVFETINGWGGRAAYDSMVTVNINGKKINMAEESEGILKIGADALPIVSENFQWTDPTAKQKEAFQTLVKDVDKNELVASLTSDLMRGAAKCVGNGAFSLPLDGAIKILMEDMLKVFETSTRDNIADDLDMLIDIYLIMCDDGILVAFNDGASDVLTDLLSARDANGDTPIDHIINRLNASERGKPVINTLTKVSLSLMQGSLGMDETSEQLYENVRNDLHDVLSHNKSDFATNEEYREAISNDLDIALENNNIVLGDDVKQNMLDYIEENYSSTDEITDDDINNAILSYYNSYAQSKENNTIPNENE